MATVRNNADYIPEMVQRIVDAVHPLRVILFGSHARGDARPDSDVDFLIVISDDVDRDQAWLDAAQSLRSLGVPKDLVVVRRSDLDRYRNTAGFIYRPALREGRVLYDAA